MKERKGTDKVESRGERGRGEERGPRKRERGQVKGKGMGEGERKTEVDGAQEQEGDRV